MRAQALADEINELIATHSIGADSSTPRRVTLLDIGGGMPVDYGSDAPDAAEPERITPSRYRAALQAEAPELFDGRYSLVTEFGRSASAKAGYMISRVEYTKSAGGRRQHLFRKARKLAPLDDDRQEDALR